MRIWIMLLAMMFGGVCLGAEKPNIVFILVDDLGWMDLGCYGSDYYETPHIDRLAKEGLKFTDAYAACAVCSPTRASIMTGRYPARLHVTDWIPGRTPPGTAMGLPDWTKRLELSEVTLAEVLGEAGYVSASMGKWHLGDKGWWPTDQGFDENFAGSEHGSHRTMFAPYKQLTVPNSPKGQYLTDRLTDEAVRFIEENKAGPFFLYLSHYAVHGPIQSKDDDAALFDEVGREGRIHSNQEYAGMLWSVDQSTGRILETLDRLGLDDKTAVFFYSDNGGLVGYKGVTNNTPLREGKGRMYEGGVRVPLMVRWPGVVEGGCVNDSVVSSVDVLPTLAAMAGVKPPKDVELDGVSLLGVMKGEVEGVRRGEGEGIYWHYPHYNAHTPEFAQRPYGAVRVGDWKLIEHYEDGKLELYHLKSDLGERIDLAQVEKGRAKKMAGMLKQWRKEVGAQMGAKTPENHDEKAMDDWIWNRRGGRK